jgi:hypothetical protein
MVSTLTIANSILLFLFVSMYLGTGWSLVLFTFPVAPQLTVDNYYLVFVPEVSNATRFFTGMTKVMVASAAVGTVAEWRSGYAWAPAAVLILVVASTVLTVRSIFPYNRRMQEGISNPALLRETLQRWMALNRIRTGLWTAQWLTMAIYFGLKLH